MTTVGCSLSPQRESGAASQLPARLPCCAAARSAMRRVEFGAHTRQLALPFRCVRIVSPRRTRAFPSTPRCARLPAARTLRQRGCARHVALRCRKARGATSVRFSSRRFVATVIGGRAAQDASEVSGAC
jgi:hypothetical protein